MSSGQEWRMTALPFYFFLASLLLRDQCAVQGFTEGFPMQ